MPAQPTSTSPISAQPISAQPGCAASLDAERAHDYRQVLHELVGMGMEMARLVLAEAQAGAPATDARPAPTPAPTPTQDAVPAFDRVARAIRRTVLLARHLDDPLPARPEPKPAPAREAARKRILREIEDRIEWESAGPRETERFEAELRDRLDGPDLDEDIATRPIADVIADIWRDMGLGRVRGGRHSWKRRTPADVAALCAQAAQPPARPPAQPSAQLPAGHAPAAPGGHAPPAQPEDPERLFRLLASPNLT